jgi:aspartokinase
LIVQKYGGTSVGAVEALHGAFLEAGAAEPVPES